MADLSDDLRSAFVAITLPVVADWHTSARKDYLVTLKGSSVYTSMDWDGSALNFTMRLVRCCDSAELVAVLKELRMHVGEEKKPSIGELCDLIQNHGSRTGVGIAAGQATAHIDRIDARGAPGEQQVDEAVTGRAKVEAGEAAGVDRELAKAIDGLEAAAVAQRSSAKAIRLWALHMPMAQLYLALPSIHALIEEYDPARHDTTEDIVELAQVVCTQFGDIMAGIMGLPPRSLSCSIWLRGFSPENADMSQTSVSPLAFSDPFDGRRIVAHKAYESSIAAALSGLKDSAGNDWLPQQSHCFCCNNLLINEFITPTMNWRMFF